MEASKRGMGIGRQRRLSRRSIGRSGQRLADRCGVGGGAAEAQRRDVFMRSGLRRYRTSVPSWSFPTRTWRQGPTWPKLQAGVSPTASGPRGGPMAPTRRSATPTARPRSVVHRSGRAPLSTTSTISRNSDAALTNDDDGHICPVEEQKHGDHNIPDRIQSRVVASAKVAAASSGTGGNDTLAIVSCTGLAKSSARLQQRSFSATMLPSPRRVSTELLAVAA